jgi:hypothetical protein
MPPRALGTLQATFRNLRDRSRSTPYDYENGRIFPTVSSVTPWQEPSENPAGDGQQSLIRHWRILNMTKRGIGVSEYLHHRNSASIPTRTSIATRGWSRSITGTYRPAMSPIRCAPRSGHSGSSSRPTWCRSPRHGNIATAADRVAPDTTGHPRRSSAAIIVAERQRRRACPMFGDESRRSWPSHTSCVSTIATEMRRCARSKPQPSMALSVGSGTAATAGALMRKCSAPIC